MKVWISKKNGSYWICKRILILKIMKKLIQRKYIKAKSYIKIKWIIIIVILIEASNLDKQEPSSIIQKKVSKEIS